MAKVGVAYVEILPDTTGFAGELREKLKAITVKYEVQIVPRVVGFTRDLREKLRAMANVQARMVEPTPDLTGFREKLQARIATMAPVTVSVRVVPDMTGFRARLRAEAQAIASDFTLIEGLFEPTPRVRAKVRRAGRLAGEDYENEFIRATRGMGDIIFASIGSLGRIRGLSLLRGFAGMAKDIQKSVAGAFTTIGDFLAKSLAGVGLGAGTAMGAAMASGMTSAGAKAAQETVTVIADVLTEGGEKVAQTTATIFMDAAEGIGSSLVKAGAGGAGGLGQIPPAAAAAGGSIAAIAGPIGAVVAAIAGLVVGMTALSVIAAVVQTALAAISAVVVALVAAVEAAVAAVVQLVATLASAVALVPGLIATIGPAVAVIGTAFSALSDAMDDPKTRLGAMAQAFKEMVVESAGLVRILTQLAHDVLPTLLGPIMDIGGAVRELFTAFAGFASQPAVLGTIRDLLIQSAAVVRQFIPTMLDLVGLFLILAKESGPAITRLIASFGKLINVVGSWLAGMATAGRMAEFFDKLALALDRLFGLVGALIIDFGTFFDVVLGPAAMLSDLIADWAEEWTAFLSTSVGADKFTSFFESLNRVLGMLMPVIDTIVMEIVRFQPILESLMAIVGPLLEDMATTIGDLLASAAPGFIAFMEAARDILGSPEMKAAFIDLGAAWGALMRSLILFDPTSAAQFVRIFAELMTGAAGLIEVLKPLIDVFMALAETFVVLNGPAFWAIVDGLRLMAAAFLVLNGDARGAQEALDVFADRARRAAPDTDTLVGKVRALGVGYQVTDAQIIAAANDIARANNGVVSNTWAMADSTANAFASASSAATAWANQVIRSANAAANAMKPGSLGELLGRLTGPAVISGGSALTSNLFWAEYDRRVGAIQSGATAAGAKSGGGGASKAAATVNKSVLEAINPAKWVGAAFNTGKELGTAIARGVVTSTKDIPKALQKLFNTKALKFNLDKLLRFVLQRNAIIAKIANAQKALDTLKEAKAEFAQAVKNVILSERDISNVFQGWVDVGSVIDLLRGRLEGIEKFRADLDKLASLGLDKEMLAQWAQAGPAAAGALVQGLAETATAADVTELNRLWGAIGDQADSASTQLSSQFYDAGIEAAKGFLDGLLKEKAALDKAIATIAAGLVKALKKALGIKSPSQVFYDLALETVAGYQKGLDTSEVSFDGVTIPEAPMAALDKVTRMAFAKPDTNLVVRVFIGDTELTDIIRTEVSYAGEEGARELMAGRRLP